MNMRPTLVALAFLLAACSAPAIQPDEDANASSSASSDMLIGSGTTTYTNDGYGFSVVLPSHFEALKGTAPQKNKYGAYIKDNALQFEGATDAIMSLESVDTVIKASFGFYVNVFPAKGYNRIELYDSPNYEYLYDAETDTWTSATTKEKIEFESRMIGGRKAYEMGFGDAGQSVTTYAVPLPEKDVVIEFIFGSCVACTSESPNGLSEDQALIDANAAHVEKETEEILKGIAFED